MIARYLFAYAFCLGLTRASAQDSSHYGGDNPQPGLVIHLDPANALVFSDSAQKPGTLRWTILCSTQPAPGTGGLVEVSREAGLINEPSIYEWDPKTHTFWFGWLGMVQKETLISDGRTDWGISRGEGGQWAVPRRECLGEIQGAPGSFVAKMKRLLSAGSGH